MHVIPVYAAADSPRLQFVLDWMLTERLGLSFRLITGQDVNNIAGPGFCYGTDVSGCLTIPDSGTLYGVSPYVVDADSWVVQEGSEPFAAFDLFSAVFFLLSRMEEWESIAEDEHGRYPHTESVLFKAGLLHRAVVDEWVEVLRKTVERVCGIAVPRKPFTFQPTYDIDMAWAYRYKGTLRNTGGALRDVLRGRFSAAGQRLKIMCVGGSRDPYDSFGRLQGLHDRTTLRPRWFVLAAGHPSRYDKNASPAHPAMRRLIRSLSEKGDVGLHPSYFSRENEDVFLAEKSALEEIADKKMAHSRQHFLRSSIRYTPRFLLYHGITDDYTMGYAAATGFRAGTSHSFPWYDLEAEKSTALRLHPFAFMDSAAHFYEKLPAEEAMQKLRGLADGLRETGGVLTTVFHNYSLGTDKEWKGWWEGYRDFVETLPVDAVAPAETRRDAQKNPE